MKQKLILITGSPCVGKTTVADLLYQSYENSAFFDGDWAWCVNPFSVTDPRLRNGDRVMAFALDNYLQSGFDYVVFSSVVIMYEDIRRPILKGITASEYEVVSFTLTCSEETLRARHRLRGDEGDCSMHWLHEPVHSGDHIICTDGMTPAEVVAKMRAIIDHID
ncbi:MAG: AAA family ATPase [Clostridia bacterium]|nr:AAA family ATPase [Clostridia bacterium]